jgi:hypothetical protein
VGLATAEFLVEGATRGVRFDRAATIGRQALFLAPGDAERLLKRHGFLPGAQLREQPGFLDPVLGVLGAQEVTSIDASPYEGATVVHDLNTPVPEDLEQRFSVVFDGGTLEHVFNVPVAMESYMRMVEVGGHLIIHTMANNYLGHGFYQFSPEFFFRILRPENGFQLERIVVLENEIAWRTVLGVPIPLERAGPWHEVVDPAEAGDRVVLQNSRPVVMQVQARRVAVTPLFATVPQQSDYSAVWTGQGAQPAAPAGLGASIRDRLAARLTPERKSWLALGLAPRVLRILPRLPLRRETRERSLRNRRFYRRVDRRHS